ncbi:hypothetical protein L1D31_13820 [Vibrio sp. Isolate23]|uniref:ribonuclease toxin immunity protein CdiI n=1 Tax=Vibrio sp. Isolate23 TaxID=2908533 RepID=UPI001EFCA62D|nr:ribonuclease toxin immunity protein CdiI [Vibrio sp. Isolate23]MCG9683646.1 hypothetical protein [Vibrio sp. Isolate23]
MNEELFKNFNRNTDPFRICKEFFNARNNIAFLSSIGYLLEGISYGDEYSSCEFPDNLEDDEEPFEGVRFRFFDDEVIVSDEVFKDLVVLACERYEEIHPHKSSEIRDLLSRL